MSNEPIPSHTTSGTTKSLLLSTRVSSALATAPRTEEEEEEEEEIFAGGTPWGFSDGGKGGSPLLRRAQSQQPLPL